jgi:hypothetical protein
MGDDKLMLGVPDEPENSSPDLIKTHEGTLDGDAVENIPGRRIFGRQTFGGYKYMQSFRLPTSLNQERLEILVWTRGFAIYT